MTDISTPGASLHERVAEELRALLGRRRMSAAALAKELGVSQTYVWRRLSGETAFDLRDVERISAILQIAPLDLLRATEGIATLRYNQSGHRPNDRPRSGRPPNRTGPAELNRGRTYRTRPPARAA